MSDQFYIPDPPTNEQLIDKDGNATFAFQRWMRDVQTSCNGAFAAITTETEEE